MSGVSLNSYGFMLVFCGEFDSDLVMFSFLLPSLDLLSYLLLLVPVGWDYVVY